MLTDKWTQILMDVAIVSDQIAFVDERSVAFWTFVISLGKMPGHVTVQVLLSLERSAASDAFKDLKKNSICKYK